MKYSFFSVVFTRLKAGHRTRDWRVIRRAKALVPNGLLILFSWSMISFGALADAQTPTPPPAARESEIQRGYAFCRDGSFRSELHCTRAAENQHKQKPSKPFLFGVYYRIWEDSQRWLESASRATPPVRDLDTIKGMGEQRDKYLGLARTLREEIGLGTSDCWQFSLQEPCGESSSPTPAPEENGR